MGRRLTGDVGRWKKFIVDADKWSSVVEAES
jgi:hypothetical protein